MSSKIHTVEDWAPSAADQQQIEAHGLSIDEIRRQLQLLNHPPAATRLDRACTVGDGIVRLSDTRFEHYQTLFQEAVSAGRFSKFVPASGAASRMFQALLVAYQEGATAPSEAVDELLAAVDRLPFRADLKEELARRGLDLKTAAEAGDAAPILDAMLGEDGLGFAGAAKALIPFHLEVDSGRGLTALEEQVVEAAEHLKDASGRCRIHLTIPQHQELLFRDQLRQITARLEENYGVDFEISLSVQGPETDTVAANPSGEPFRDDAGRLVFRPGGHGALLGNLERFAPDLVFLRNIDNIQPAHHRREVLRWNRILGGYLVELEAELAEILSQVERARPDDHRLAEQLRRVAAALGRPDLLSSLEGSDQGGSVDPVEQAFLIDILDRPLRVVGMVPNTGEPGGGPFWVTEGPGRVTPQIVELSQIDKGDPRQEQIVQQATHFNPVHLVCRVRDHRGNAFDLSRFVDPDAAFSSLKSYLGRELRALEHPGLWNGSMARWNTVFVEVPGEIFAPVKTVFDLLRPEHQPEV